MAGATELLLAVPRSLKLSVAHRIMFSFFFMYAVKSRMLFVTSESRITKRG